MKKLALTFLSFIVLLCLLSCELEFSNNGKLDGYWKLRSIDSLSTGKTADYTDSTYFWSVQYDLLQVTNAATNEKIVFRFKDTKDLLSINTPYISNREEGDIVVDNPMILHPYGIQDLTENFLKVTLKSGKMVLESNNGFRLHFQKF